MDKRTVHETFVAIWRWLVAVAWLLTAVLVCFLLYRIVVNGNATHHLKPITMAQRDSLAMVTTPIGMADTLVRYEAMAVHFNRVRHVANCAVYELTDRELQGDAMRQGTFEQDAGVEGCPAPEDYAGSGFDRGHLVPAADLKWSELAMSQSFLLTNVCPMSKALNEGGWAKLEQKVREWVRRDSALLVFAGPVYAAGDTTLASGVAVPSSYFKVIFAPCVSPRRAIAFIYPNGYSGGRLRDYAVSVEQVERLTGLRMLEALPADERASVKQTVNLNVWLN